MTPVSPRTKRRRFRRWPQRWRDRIAITYRRRTVNTGYKAGNIRDFCEQWGGRHELAVTLDADSFMTADAILRLVRIMQADPGSASFRASSWVCRRRACSPASSSSACGLACAPTRIGSAWWQADCGPYWGHNAVLRLQPFIEHCVLPVLGGTEDERHILSHDQIEAALMRSAGYHVRVLVREDLGWEENPPTLLEFMRRDLRWCQGNMQYWRFLSLPNLKPVSRYQLMLAILMFIGSPAWIGLLVVATIALVLNDRPARFRLRGCWRPAAVLDPRHVVLAEDRGLRRSSASADGATCVRRRRWHG